MSQPAAVAAPPPHVAHEAHHEELGFWRKYVFSTDHKVIGIQYAITGLLFLLFGFSLMMLMRWQLAYPGAALPLIGRLLGETRMPGGTMLPEFYNELGAMHGTIMVFLGVVPLAVGGFGNFVLPLQIGAPGHGLPEAEHGELLVLLPRRRDDAGQLFRARRRRAGRVDVLHAPRQHRGHRARRCGSSG